MFSQIAGVLVLVGLCINVGYVYIRNRCLGSPSMCIPSSMAATTGSGIPDPNTFLGTKRHVISSKRLRNQKINPIFVMSNFSNSTPLQKIKFLDFQMPPQRPGGDWQTFLLCPSASALRDGLVPWPPVVGEVC